MAAQLRIPAPSSGLFAQNRGQGGTSGEKRGGGGLVADMDVAERRQFELGDLYAEEDETSDDENKGIADLVNSGQAVEVAEVKPSGHKLMRWLHSPGGGATRVGSPKPSRSPLEALAELGVTGEAGQGRGHVCRGRRRGAARLAQGPLHGLPPRRLPRLRLGRLRRLPDIRLAPGLLLDHHVAAGQPRPAARPGRRRRHLVGRVCHAS